MSFTGGGMGRHGECLTKRPYPNRDAADRALERREATGSMAPGAGHVYRCKKGKCRQWHISGSQLKGRKGRR